MTGDIARWFNEQFDKDERIARAAHQPNWSTDGRRGLHYGVEDEWMTDALTTADADHIAEHDPARVLRDIDGKRQLLREILKYEVMIEDGWGCGHDVEDIPALRLLASPYEHRPGYPEAWR